MASKGNASTKILTETVWFASQRKTSATTSPFLATSSTASPSRIMSEASCVRHLLEFSILKVKRALITGLAVAADVAHGHKAYRLPGMAAIRIRWRPAALGRLLGVPATPPNREPQRTSRRPLRQPALDSPSVAQAERERREGRRPRKKLPQRQKSIVERAGSVVAAPHDSRRGRESEVHSR